MSNLIFESFNPKIHDASKVAELMYDVDFRTFDLFFRDAKEAIGAIENYLSKVGLDESLKVILDEDMEIIGMVEFYISKKPHSFKFKSLKLYLVDILDYFVLCDIKKGDLYIAEIAIDKSLRGQGLGNEVLSCMIDYAKSKDMNRVILDVDFRNGSAKSLYVLKFSIKRELNWAALREECIIWS